MTYQEFFHLIEQKSGVDGDTLSPEYRRWHQDRWLFEQLTGEPIAWFADTREARLRHWKQLRNDWKLSPDRSITAYILGKLRELV